MGGTSLDHRIKYRIEIVFRIIAILFGVLGMSVEEVSDEFITFYKEVFADTTLSKVQRSLKLEKAVLNLLERHNISPDTKLFRGAPARPTTKTYVSLRSRLNVRFQ